MKEIKTRIASVENTKQITKAMELVASSKFRKAKERTSSNRKNIGIQAISKIKFYICRRYETIYKSYN